MSAHHTGLYALPSGPDVVAEVFDGEAVVVHLTTGVYYSFDRPATMLWEVLSAGIDQPTGAQRRFLAFLVHEELAAWGALSGAEVSDESEWPGVDRFTDMADLLVLDPIHDIDLDGTGWPIAEGAQAATDAVH